jgi:hypothetical protein
MKRIIISLILFSVIAFSQAPVKRLRLKNGTSDITIDSAKILSGSLIFYINGNGGYSIDTLTIAKVDSFATTAVLDTIILPGLKSTDALFVSWVTTLSSPTADTGSTPYWAQFLNTDSALVYRMAKNITGSTVKSNGIYSILRKR